MKNNRPDLSPNLEFTQYYQLNSNPKTALLMEQENSNTPKALAVENRDTPEKAIMIALGFIATLLFCSGMQLYRSVNLVPAKAKAVKSNQAFVLDAQKLSEGIPLRELESVQNELKIEILSLQNAISQGKY